jgi:hypothetical protein
MSICARCGQDISGAATVCPHCGEYLNPSGADGGFAAWLSAQASAVGSAPTDWPPLGTPSPEETAARPWDGQVAVSAAPQQRGLVGGHLTLRRASATGTLEDGEYVFELSGRDITIGRSPSCDIALAEDPLVSRRHAILYCKNDGYTIVDLASANGTYLNEREVHEEVEIHNGDRISVGQYHIFVSSAPANPNATTMEARATGPLPLLPSEDTDPHLASGAAPQAPALDFAAPQAPASAAEPQPESFADADPLASALPPLAPMPAAPVTPQRDLDALQSQLTSMISGLRQQAEEDAATAQRLRQALTDVYEVLTTALATQLEPASVAFAFNVDKLTEMARYAAENPRHLDHILGLAEHADELTLVLEAVQKLQASGGALAPLQALRGRVEQALS